MKESIPDGKYKVAVFDNVESILRWLENINVFLAQKGRWKKWDYKGCVDLVDRSTDCITRPKIFNKYQQSCLEKMLSNVRVFICQGPPGTGKTSVMAQAVKLEVEKNRIVAVTSESNAVVATNAKGIFALLAPEIQNRMVIDAKYESMGHYLNGDVKNCLMSVKLKALTK